MKKITTKQIVFSAAAIALATVIATSPYTKFKWPWLWFNGGSITLFSLLFITLIGYW